MKLGLIMFYDEAIEDYAYFSYKINEMYCEKYGIKLILSKTKTYKNRHPAWERLPLILKNLKNYDYLIWVDADAFFYYDSDNILDIIKKNYSSNFIFSNDIKDKNINTGFFIVKNTEYSFNFLNRWAFDENLYESNTMKYWWDQGVLIYIFENNILNIKENSITYDYGILQDFNFSESKKKPFICHLAGKDKNTRVSIIKDYFKNICEASF